MCRNGGKCLPGRTESRRGEARRVALIALALALASGALYGRAVGFDFVDFDDRKVVLAHPDLYDEKSLRSSLHEIFVGYFPREEPLLVRDVSWALDARLFGHANPLGYHLGNVLLNGLAVALLFLFLHHATRRLHSAWILAALFAVLPIHVEPVCWVMGRKDLLVACFLLLALLAQSHELAAADARRRWLFYAATLLCMVLALFSKVSAVVAFALLGLHRVFAPYLDGRRAPGEPLGLAPTLRDVVPRMLPHTALCIAVFVWYHGVLHDYGVLGWRGVTGFDVEHLALVARFAPLVIGQYLAHLAWPVELSMYYRWPHAEIPLTPLELLGSAAIAALVLGLLAWSMLRRRDLAFYLLAFAVFMVPHLNLIYVGIWVADRYVYLACFCLLAAAAIPLAELRLRATGAARLLPLALALVFGVLSLGQTWRLQSVWRDDAALWSYEAYRARPSLLSIQALAKLQLKRGEREADPARRAAWAERARVELERGLARSDALGRVATRYKTTDQLHLSRLHLLRGRLAALTGEPIERQVEHLELSHAIAPDRLNAMLLARSYFHLAEATAESRREGLARRSLDYFIEYASWTQSDPRQLAESRSLFVASYDERRFPFLADEIRQARRTLFP